MAHLVDRRPFFGRPFAIEPVVDKVVLQLDRAVCVDDVVKAAAVVRARGFCEKQVGDAALFHAVSHGVGNRVVTLGIVQLGRTVGVGSPDPLDLVVRPVAHDVGLMNSGFDYGSSRPRTVGSPDPVCGAALFFGASVLYSVILDTGFGNHGHRCHPLALKVVVDIGVAAVVAHLEANGACDAGLRDRCILADDVVKEQ